MMNDIERYLEVKKKLEDKAIERREAVSRLEHATNRVRDIPSEIMVLEVQLAKLRIEQQTEIANTENIPVEITTIDGELSEANDLYVKIEAEYDKVKDHAPQGQTNQKA